MPVVILEACDAAERGEAVNDPSTIGIDCETRTEVGMLSLACDAGVSGITPPSFPPPQGEGSAGAQAAAPIQVIVQRSLPLRGRVAELAERPSEAGVG